MIILELDMQAKFHKIDLLLWERINMRFVWYLWVVTKIECLGIGWMNISGQHITNMHNNSIKIYIDLNCVFMLIGSIVSVIQGYGRKEEKF